MLEWVFGEKRIKDVENEEVDQNTGSETLSSNRDNLSNGDASDESDSFLFEATTETIDETDHAFSIESLDTPEFHAQQSLLLKVRNDVEDFDHHITQNEIHLKHTREQLIGFRAFVQQTDVELAQIHGLNRQNSDLKRKLDGEDQRASELQSRLDNEIAEHAATKNRNFEFKDVLGTARAEIITLSTGTSKLRAQLKRYETSSSKREALLQGATRKAEQLLAENKVLDEKYQRANFDMNKFYKEATVLQKTIDEINENGRQGTAEIDRLAADLTGATESVDKYQAENVELQSRLDNMIAESAAIDKRNNSKIRIRDEEMYSLRSQVEGLQSELRVRNQMLTQATEEGSKLDEELKIATSKAQSFREQLTHEVSQNEEQRKSLTEANERIAEVNKRYKGMLSELEQSRQENLRLKRLLKAELQMFEQSISSLQVAKNGTKKSRSRANIPDPQSAKLN
jgi:DNA repair exonuclease SbcCD ATPase subunit